LSDQGDGAAGTGTAALPEAAGGAGGVVLLEGRAKAQPLEQANRVETARPQAMSMVCEGRCGAA